MMFKDILSNSIPLSVAIRMVQAELIKSQKEREEQNESSLFKVDKLVIEANCVFTKNASSKLGFDVKLLSLFSAGTEMKIDSGSSFMQKIILELKVNEDIYSPESGIYPHDDDEFAR